MISLQQAYRSGAQKRRIIGTPSGRKPYSLDRRRLFTGSGWPVVSTQSSLFPGIGKGRLPRELPPGPTEVEKMRERNRRILEREGARWRPPSMIRRRGRRGGRLNGLGIVISDDLVSQINSGDIGPTEPPSSMRGEDWVNLVNGIVSAGTNVGTSFLENYTARKIQEGHDEATVQSAAAAAWARAQAVLAGLASPPSTGTTIALVGVAIGLGALFILGRRRRR
jgi:hypothetical protein